MNIAFVGCGFVAAYYGDSLANYPELRPLAAFDIDPSRLSAFSKQYNIPIASSFQAILDNPDIDLIVNLTPPASHVEISRAALLAGKHVYSEKPLSLDRAGAEELIALAAKQDRLLAVAPCNFLGWSMQTLARLVRDDVVGTPRLVYAEIDDGPIHQMAYTTWSSTAGVSWPAEMEFRVGCVWEHAAYEVGFMTSLFGPAATVTSFSHTLVTDKMEGLAPQDLGPDFCVGLIHFHSGVVARLTIGTIARRNRSMTITGDKGILHVPEIWDFEAPVQFAVTRGSTAKPTSSLLLVDTPPNTPPESEAKSSGTGPSPERGIQVDTQPPPMDTPRLYATSPSYRMDMSLGLAEIAAALRDKRRPRMAADHAFHIYEILQALNDSVAAPGHREITSKFVPIDPMPALQTTASNCTISW
ncbi:oxidoreductase domain-containing protein [Microdochium trichocladiopsis]|uniref:Oxidoreductase domain-containing protein n=1 Tax=Microdochium trichocladiopsis TaxID=1682393 RepID=A0A9P9BLK5_9PEZI|nr:oxidoreductase domain-containing protein [Microdochium trichocladiopsis]KAH7024490.1 oxidoreductase domain-containing protein [Microdochium trichocladiopsis]